MRPDPLYLDANATEPLRPEARAAALMAMDLPGNPSSVHTAGRAARRLLETAREQLAARFGAAPRDIVFCAGGTEANALAIQGLSAGPPALVCLMAANNETGVLHPLAEALALCRRHGALLHIDAVQAAGRVPLALLGDSMAISGHKLGGPKGAGALLLRPGLSPTAIFAGGGQESGRRGGTEPLPAIAGLGAAAEAADPGQAQRLAILRDALEAGALGATVIGATAPRLPNTTSLLLPGVAAETQVIAMDLAGVAVSAGSACSSGKVAASSVLAAMGLGADAGCAIRVSLPWNAPDDAPARFIAAWGAMRDRARRRAA